jgi:hypothetical protein
MRVTAVCLFLLATLGLPGLIVAQRMYRGSSALYGLRWDRHGRLELRARALSGRGARTSPFGRSASSTGRGAV